MWQWNKAIGRWSESLSSKYNEAYTGNQGKENGLSCYMYFRKEKKGHAHL